MSTYCHSEHTTVSSEPSSNNGLKLMLVASSSGKPRINPLKLFIKNNVIIKLCHRAAPILHAAVSFALKVKG